MHVRVMGADDQACREFLERSPSVVDALDVLSDAHHCMPLPSSHLLNLLALALCPS